jgi:hypothetical protein
MQTFTWSGQVSQNHELNENENKSLTCWQQECPNCGEMSAISPFQFVHDVNDSHTGRQVYVRISTVCRQCCKPMTEIWSIN